MQRRKELTTIVTKSRELGYAGIELDARLALAEIEMTVGQATAGRAHSATIETDAKTKGYNLIARKVVIRSRLSKGLERTEQLRPGKAVLDEMESVQNGTIVRLWSNNCAFVSFQ